MDTQRNARGNPRRKTSEEDLAKANKQKFITQAMERWKRSAESTSETRKESLDDFRFRIGEQWPDDVKRKRGKKPTLTINRIGAFCNQVTNEQRQQRPSGTVNPVGSGSDVDTAEILQGMIRHIEVNCDAEVADDIAFEHMVIGGWGWLGLYAEFSDDDPDDPFAQEIKQYAIPNPFTVYDDPDAKHPLRTDAKWRFIIKDMQRDEYKAEYPNSDLAGLDSFHSYGDKPEGWLSKDSVRIAEYFVVEATDDKMAYQLADGSITDKLPEGQTAVKSRMLTRQKVMRYIINAIESLEERELPGTIIPQVPVLGYNLNVDGKQYLAGLVRAGKDPARAYNYHLTAATIAVALAPKMPFILAEGQAEGHESEWKNSNSADLGALFYKPIQVGGSLVGRPQRETAEPPIQAISHLLLTADTDMKAVTGLFDPSLGQKSPDQSGKAIVALQRQGNVATSNFSDNLARAKRELTRLMLTWIPVIYDTPRIRRIIKPDGTVDHVAVYNSTASGGTTEDDAKGVLADQLEKKGIEKVFDIGVGKYDVTVSIGPSYQTKRQEAVASIMALVGAYPELVHICGDLMIGQMDIPLAKEIAERVKRTIPPNILGDGDGDDPEANLARVQGELQQLMQQHDESTQQLQQAVEIIKTKKIETQGKAEIAKMQDDAKIQIVKIQTAAQVEVAGLTNKLELAKIDFQRWQLLHDSAHDVGQQAVDHEHEKEMQQASAAQAQQSQESDQAHQADQATQAQEAAQPEATA